MEISNSSTGALADEEEYFDISADSLESNCKQMKLDSIFESLSPENRHNSSVESPHSAMIESPESPVELENSNESDADDNSEVFIVESQTTQHRIHNKYSHSRFSGSSKRRRRKLLFCNSPWTTEENECTANKPFERTWRKELVRSLLPRCISPNREPQAVPTFFRKRPCHSPLPVWHVVADD